MLEQGEGQRGHLIPSSFEKNVSFWQQLILIGQKKGYRLQILHFTQQICHFRLWELYPPLLYRGIGNVYF